MNSEMFSVGDPFDAIIGWPGLPAFKIWQHEDGEEWRSQVVFYHIPIEHILHFVLQI